MTILGLAKFVNMMNQPDPARPDRDAIWRIISRKIWMRGMWNFNTIFMQVLNLSYYSFGSISLVR